jgi:ligand-binding sensor domain-containing protein/signal transduction histidine kinase
MLKNRWPLTAVVLVLCGSWSGFANIADAKVSAESPFIVDVWESGAGEQKLPQSSVIAITQTRDGYLWLGTLNGLVRFDGTRFTVFNNANMPGLDCDRIVHLFEDSRTNLWVGTEPGGVVFIKADGSFQKLGIGRGGTERRLISTCEDSTGAVWLYFADGQLSRYRNGKTETWSFGADQFPYSKTVIAEPGGMVWAGAFRAHAAINPNAQFTDRAMPLQEIIYAGVKQDFLLASKSGGYWRLADGRIQKWNGTRLVRDLAAYQWKWTATNSTVTCACEDAQGNPIVGTWGEGVFWYDANGHATQISTAQGLSQNARGIVLSLCLDREGNLWVGTDGGGLNRVKKRVFEVLDESKDWTIQSVREDEQGGFLIGTFGNGLKYSKDGVVRQLGTRQPGMTNLFVRAVFVNHDQKVFFSADGYGLFEIANGWFNQYTNSEIASPFISAIHEDRSGKLWFGTQAGLVCKNKLSWKKFTKREGLTSDSVSAIADDAAGNIWIGTEGGGLNCFSNGQFAAFHKTNGLPGETITALMFDRDGVLWIGTDGAGLGRLQHGAFANYSKQTGLLNDSIGYLIEDTRSNLWMGSYAGLMRVSKKSLNDFAEKKTDFIPCRVFGKSDGLPTSECTQGSQPAACLARDGKLWFPTKQGVVSVNPLDLKNNTNRPPVIIESVLVEAQEQITNAFASRLQSLTIPPGKEGLDIYYTSLNFSAPDNVRFKYQLEGYQLRPVEAGNSRVAGYPKLPPGNYLFRVIAFNEDGYENTNGATLAIIVQPAFWQTASFKIVVALCLLGIIGGLIYYFSTQKLQRELAVLKQHEELEQERARIARDLHDQLGANLTQVSLLGELAEADKDLPVEVEAHAQQICQTARETARALDEIVWAINPSNDTLEGLINYACKYAQEYLELAGVSHRFDVPAQLPAATIAPEVRHNVFLAFKESVNNIVKHAQASAVWIRLRLEPHAFTIEIEDNGRGLSGQNEKSGRNGLRNMRKRMEDVGGIFSIGPAAERGTVVRLTATIAKR